MAEKQDGPNFGLGSFASWANLGAVVVMFYMFYQAQSNAFEMYRADKLSAREDLKVQWEAIRSMQSTQANDMRGVTDTLKDLQRVNREMLDELKALRKEKP